MADATLSTSSATGAMTEGFDRRSAKELWRGDTPAEIKRSWKAGDTAGAWETLRAGLADDSERAALRDVLQSLSWGLPEPTAFLTRMAEAAKRKKGLDLDAFATDWLEESPAEPDSTAAAIDTLAWAWAVSHAPTAMPTTLWLRVIERLVAGCEGTLASARSLINATPEQTLWTTLVAGEASLVLATQLRRLRPAHDLLDPARDLLTDSLLELTDGEGFTTARLLPVLPCLLASWTRCQRLGSGLRRGVWSGDAQTQYEWFVRQALRMADANGRLPFAEGEANAWQSLAAAIEADGDDEDHAAARSRLGLKLGGSADAPPEASVESEWSECAVLASGWNPKAPQVVVAWDRPTMRLVVRGGGRAVVEGDWPIIVRRNGQLLATHGEEWESQCWYSDEDCDYLELALALPGGARLERQVILGRKDAAVAIGELVTGDGDDADWQVETRLSLPAGTAFNPENETRDGVLFAGKQPLAACLPASLPEWRLERSGGELAAADGTLRLQTDGNGRNLASLLWLDLAPKRFQKQRTWRRLAVAASLKKVTADVAVGYRVQSGKDQWLYYRSLDPPANRTVLGQNLSSEAFVGRFLPTGEVDEYFEIEADD